MLRLVSGINSRLLSVSRTLIFPTLTHPVIRVALPSAPSTHHSHHPSPLHSFIPRFKPSFSANSSHCNPLLSLPGLTPRISRTVYRYFSAYPFLVFSFSVFHFLVFGSVRAVDLVSALSGRYRSRSTGSADYVLPGKRTRFGERGFSYCGPAAWNTFPSDLYDTTDTGTFIKRLKSMYFLIILQISR